jgi:capsular polysaccharide biosynthesis protein
MAAAQPAGSSGPIAATVGKVEAVRALAARAGLADVDAEGAGVAAALAAVGRVLGRLSNPHVELRDSAAVAGVATRLVFGKAVRGLVPPLHLSGMPGCFTEQSPVAHSPDFSVLTLQGGYFCHYRDGPLVVTARGNAVLRDYSSRFAGLVHHYETDLRQVLADAYQLDGTAVVIADDVRPLNFCHWIVDWLPRLAFLGEQARQGDTCVIVPPLQAHYQWDTLAMCGFPARRVIQLGTMQAVRARQLLVPSDLNVIPHPGHKAAPWLLSYLRAALGYGSFLAGLNGKPRRGKLYVSRGDAEGRRVLNEDVLVAALARAGYQSVVLGGMSAAQQIATFAGASHIVAPHGAGLANIVFADPATTLVEIFPASYGTAAYYVLAAGLGITYASYISHGIVPGSRTQLDDIVVDVDDFLARCEGLL